MSDDKEDKKPEIFCDCNGMPVSGAMCGYVAVGGEFCRAPTDYECKFKREE